MKARQFLADYQEAAKPLSRMYIAQKFKELEPFRPQMTVVERETYEFYITEFNYELLSLSGDTEPSELRWHLFSEELTDGIINVDVGYALTAENANGLKNTLSTKDVKFYGYVYKNVGFYFNLDDNKQWGSNINYLRLNTPQKGVISSTGTIITSYSWDLTTPPATNTLQELSYDEIDAQFSWKVGIFNFSLEKMDNIWGFGENANVILSNKAPSYPQIKMRVHLSDKIDFVYFHGELNSNATDTARSYYANSSGYSVFRDVDHTKYIAAHQIEMRLWKGVDVSVGESVVYSDRGPLLMYLLPVMFFKAGEHYNGDKDNCQIFGSLDLNLIKRTKLYFSLFIDELNTDQFFDQNDSRRQVAFTIGGHTYDILIDNLELTAEYTRANPGPYSHKYPAVTYTNNGYVLGSWTGQNADDAYLSITYRPMFKVKVSLYNEVFRKGSPIPLYDQYSSNQGGYSFLDGKQHIERMIGAKINYQPLRDIFINFTAQFHSLKDETDPAQNYNKRFEFTASAAIGLW
jgi:hypothetical protein